MKFQTVSKIKVLFTFPVEPNGSRVFVHRNDNEVHLLSGANEPLHSALSRRSRRLSLVVRHNIRLGLQPCGEAYFEGREVNAIQSAVDNLDKQTRQLLTKEFLV